MTKPTEFANIHSIAIAADKVSLRDVKAGDYIICSYHDARYWGKDAGFTYLWKIVDEGRTAVCVWCEDSVESERIRQRFAPQTMGVPTRLLWSGYSNTTKLARLTRVQIAHMGLVK
jgi:hypothetical protein